ncbi:bcl-2-related ovarian killer protein homolog A [Diachasma alloeum]|uniref:bcl-2-related ovarian killer protein homolog A n=1 Tax=Diachasma alloeum TaxID=454923 RepID=UPI0007383872|nr:bcl-2-related ovarian killer protein homolog A [Diachasma alloeum]XP_015121587.1 bcl-2-related ovarian killer protein homolog A [Diachasma alloeum]XP_015121588.1 bcl-2-related ovarian killer protein homolog A [Diachasma alloeum]
MSIMSARRLEENGVHLVTRRGSIALTLQANLAAFGSSVDSLQVVGSARRRLSNVSDAVSRRISHTIGWRSVSASLELIVAQGSSLCGQYIRNRLKRSGIFQRKLGLKRMRSALSATCSTVLTEVYPELIALGVELEKMHPNLFTRIGRQVGCGAFSSEQTATEALHDVAREMLRFGEMTWSKIIALYAVAGAIAVDCVRQDRPQFIPSIQRAMTEILEEDLASWIQANGGWSTLATKYRPPTEKPTWHERNFVILLVICTLFVGLIAIILRSLIS